MWKRSILLAEEALVETIAGTRGPGPRCMLTAVGNGDGGMAEGAVVYGKQDGTGCT